MLWEDPESDPTGGEKWVVNPFYPERRIFCDEPKVQMDWARESLIVSLVGRKDAFVLGYGLLCATSLAVRVFEWIV